MALHQQFVLHWLIWINLPPVCPSPPAWALYTLRNTPKGEVDFKVRKRSELTLVVVRRLSARSVSHQNKLLAFPSNSQSASYSQEAAAQDHDHVEVAWPPLASSYWLRVYLKLNYTERWCPCTSTLSQQCTPPPELLFKQCITVWIISRRRTLSL